MNILYMYKKKKMKIRWNTHIAGQILRYKTVYVLNWLLFFLKKLLIVIFDNTFKRLSHSGS